MTDERGRLRYETRTVSLSEIDASDRTFRLGLGRAGDTLVESVQYHGLINPPVLTQRKNGRYIIVCGFRRVEAMKALGWDEVSALVVTEPVSEARLIELAVMDNRSHRQLDLIEQAHGIQKLTWLDGESSLHAVACLLGLPANPTVFRKIEALAALPRRVQAGLLKDEISFEAAVDLTAFSKKEMMAFFELFSVLKLSQNKETEVIRMVYEIAEREDCTISAILAGDEMQGIIRNNDANRNEKGAQLRRYLRQRRFPAIVAAEKEFNDTIAELRLPRSIRITPPADFEGRLYSLCMSFKDLEGLREGHKMLKSFLDHPAMKRLLGAGKTTEEE